MCTTYTAVRVPFNDFDGCDEADELGHDAGLLVQFPQRRLAEGFARLHQSARQRVEAFHRRRAPHRQEDPILAEAGHGGGEQGTGRIEAVRAHRAGSSTYRARGRMSVPCACCSRAWASHPAVRPTAKRMNAAPLRQAEAALEQHERDVDRGPASGRREIIEDTGVARA